MSELPPPERDIVRALRQAQDRASRLYFECLQLKRDGKALADRLEVIEASVAYRLGAGIIATLKAPWRLPGLSRLLLDLYRTVRQRPDTGSEESPLLPTDFSWSSEPDPYANPPVAPTSLDGLRIAAVLDEFSYTSFSPECSLLQLGSCGFEPDLDEFKPHLLLVESAWRGQEGAWKQKIHPVSAELCYLLDCCRRRGIPTVFWNKEDPSHFDNFLASALLFDHVFTTDINCIPRYRQALGHDRVHVLPFGCQPRLQNPVESESRRAAASFAGSWYQRYVQRSRDFTGLVEEVSRVMPVHIYDRNSGRGDPSFEFPERFHPLIQGSLPFSQIGKAYKGYRFGITINTVTSSPSMLARRIYELMACNTVVISNQAVALASGFAELVLTHGDPGFIEELARLASDEGARHRRQLRGLRHVLSFHTVAHRLAFVASKVLGSEFAPRQPAVVVLAAAASCDEIDSVLDAFLTQSWSRKQLYLVTPVRDHPSFQREDVAPVAPSAAECVPLNFLDDECWIAPFHRNDYYGPEYLADLARATLYSDCPVIGKSCRFSWDSSAGISTMDGKRHCYSEVALRCSLLQVANLTEPASVLLSHMQDEQDYMVPGLAVDEFNYCRNGAGKGGVSVLDVCS